MGKIILILAVTLDGYISGPKGEIDWLVKDGEKDFGHILADIDYLGTDKLRAMEKLSSWRKSKPETERIVQLGA